MKLVLSCFTAAPICFIFFTVLSKSYKWGINDENTYKKAA